jgi:hypothetical protein
VQPHSQRQSPSIHQAERQNKQDKQDGEVGVAIRSLTERLAEAESKHYQIAEL